MTTARHAGTIESCVRVFHAVIPTDGDVGVVEEGVSYAA